MTRSALSALARNSATALGIEVRTPAMASATTDVAESIVWSDDRSGSSDGSRVVNSVSWSPDATVTGAATNNFQVNVFRRSSAGALTGGTGNNGLVAQLAFANTVNATAFTDKAIPLTSPINTTLSVGDRLTYSLVHNGTGIQSPAGKLKIDITDAG